MSLTKATFYLIDGAPANVLDYGADPTGSSDSAAAIQAALNTNRRVYIPKGTYSIESTIRFQVPGQIIYGDGRNFGADQDQTTIIWDGASGGKMLSTRASASGNHNSNCQLNDICLNGNSLAGIGWEVFDTTGSGGVWRNCSYNATIQNVTQGDGIGISLGDVAAFPNFSHDFFMVGGGLIANKIGARGNGAIYMFVNTTWSSNTVAGVDCQQGSNWTLTNCVLSQNKTDFRVNNPQNINVSGGWCEDSVDGIVTTVVGSTQNTMNFNGVYLHTANVTKLMDLGSTAGATSITGCFVPGTAGSNVVANVNPDYSFSTLGTTNIAWGNNTALNAGRGGIGNVMYGNTGNGQQMAIAAYNVANAGTLTLPWVTTNQTFCGTVSIACVSAASGNARTNSTYSVFYFQGDNTSIQLMFTAVGSGGANTFTVAANSTGIVVTNTSGVASNIFISASGTAMS